MRQDLTRGGSRRGPSEKEVHLAHALPCQLSLASNGVATDACPDRGRALRMTKATLHFIPETVSQGTVIPQNLGLPIRLAAFAVGVDRKHLARCPDAERGVVVWSSLSLLAAFTFSAASWFVALGIARGEGHPEHYAIAALFGFIIACIDRAMIRTHWLNYGARMGRQRGLSAFQARQRTRFVPAVLRWGFRFCVTLTLTFSSAAFLELELFRKDTDAAMLVDNALANKPVYAMARKTADLEESRISGDIRRLDQQAADLIASATQADAAALAANSARVSMLQAERESLLKQSADLGRAIACAKQDQIAERYAVVRCDGQKASVAKEGAKFKAASEQLDFLTTQLAQVTARRGEVEAGLLKLDQSSQTPLAALRGHLNNLATERERLTASLSSLQAQREGRINQLAKADPDYVPLADGLILRGGTLDTMAASSSWLATRIWSVWLALMVLDLSAMLATLMVTPPLVYCLREAAALETEAQRIIAASETALTEASVAAAKARHTRLAAEDETARVAQMRRTRDLYLERINHGLATNFGET